MSRIVVFGAAGTAGSRVVAEAAARGHEVTAVARDTARLGTLPDGVRAVAGDVTDLEAVSTLAKDADALVLTVGGPDAALYTDAVATVAAAVRTLGPTGPRILHMGGGSSLLDEDGVRFLLSGTFVMFKFTRAGLAMRAAVNDPLAASASGISLARVRLGVWATAGTSAAARSHLNAPPLKPAPKPRDRRRSSASVSHRPDRYRARPQWTRCSPARRTTHVGRTLLD